MKKNVIRLLFALVALLTSTSMLAENKLWIASEGDGQFAIMMDCDDNAAGMQFTLQLPDALTIVPDYIDEKTVYIQRNPERFNNGQQIRSNLVDGNLHEVLCVIVSMRGESFRGEQGTPVAYFKTKKDSSTSTWKEEDLKLTDIIFSTANGDQLEAAEESVYDGAVYGVVKAYFDLDNLLINPNSTKIKVPVALTNSFDVSGLQMNIVLPEGFTMEENEFEHTDRVATTAEIQAQGNGSTYSLVMTDIIDNESIQEGDGVIFYCFVNAPDTEVFNSDVVFSIENVGASIIDGAYVPGLGDTLEVTNGILAKNSADAEIAALQAALDAALETIATDCPDVKDNFTGEEIQTAINDLKEAVDAAYADLTLTENYDEVMAPAAGIKESIDKLVEDANAAQEAEIARRADNQAKYDEAIAAIEELQTNLNNAVTVIESDYAEYKDDEAIAAVQAKIDNAKTEADAAYEAVAAEGEFSYEVDKAGITTDIDGLILAAQAALAAADAEAGRKDANKKAYEAVLDQIQKIQEHFDATVNTIKEEFADNRDEEAEGKVQEAINDAAALAKEAYEAVAEAGEFEYTVDADALNAAIDALLDAAKADRQAKNKTAYEADLATLDELYSFYREVVATIQENYAEYENVSAELAVRNYLDDVKAAIEKAYKAVENEGVYSYDLDEQALAASIEKLLTDAQQAAADAEAARVARNEAAYNAVMDQINALKAELEAAIDKINEEYPEYDKTSKVDEINAAIVDAENAADAAKEAVSEEGEFDFTFDPELIRALINEMLEEAEISGVEAIEAEVVAGNAYIFTLDGKQHQRPVQGEVNVIVRKNGETSKIFVK